MTKYNTKTSSKLIISKTPKVYKNKKLNNANFGTYNLNDYQVVLKLISKIGGVDEFGKYLQPEQLKQEYIITAKEFSQEFDIDINTCYGILKRAGHKLARTAITLEKTELFEQWDIAVCEIAKYNFKQGSLSIKFTESIIPYLTQVKSKFVLYNLRDIANFKSLYTTRLYELIQEFKDTGFLTKSVSQLREIFAVGNKFARYVDFKRRTFEHAVNEINAQYHMNLRFTEIKEGRKIVAIEFHFIPTKIVKAVNHLTGKHKNIYIKPKRKLIEKKVSTKEKSEQKIVHLDQQELPLMQEENIQSTKIKSEGIKEKQPGIFEKILKGIFQKS